jgi:hypothetical protein
MNFFKQLWWTFFHKPYFIPGKYYKCIDDRGLLFWEGKTPHKCLGFKWSMPFNEYFYSFGGIGDNSNYVYDQHIYMCFKEVPKPIKSEKS